MLQSSFRTATLVVLSVALATPRPCATPQSGPGGARRHRMQHRHRGPRRLRTSPRRRHALFHTVSAPRAAPQPSAPRIASPTPRVAPAPHPAPQQLARPSGGPPPGAAARHQETPRVLATPRQEKQQIGGRVGGQGGAQVGGVGAGPVAGQVGRGPGRSSPDAAQPSRRSNAPETAAEPAEPD